MLSRPRQALAFLVVDPEFTNLTYELANLDELGAFLGRSLGVDSLVVQRYLDELERDDLLRSELNERLRAHGGRKRIAMYGRRTGWYALVRIVKPHLIVESGVFDGLGSTVLLQALARNAPEGHDGRLIGIDIDSASGWLVPEQLRSRFTLRICDSLIALPEITQAESIDLFIHDSDHHYQHEFQEYSLVSDGLSPHGLLLSDNAHVCSALMDFSAQRHRSFYFWHERPKNHIDGGAGIGLSPKG